MTKKEYVPKPMTFYVSNISEADGEHFGQEMERIIDVSISNEQAVQLIRLLSKNVDSFPGTRTFRLKGRLIL